MIAQAGPLELACLGTAGSAAVVPEGSACAERAIASGRVRLTGQVAAEWPFGLAEQLLLFSVGLQGLRQQRWQQQLEGGQVPELRNKGIWVQAPSLHCFEFSSIVSLYQLSFSSPF